MLSPELCFGSGGFQSWTGHREGQVDARMGVGHRGRILRTLEPEQETQDGVIMAVDGLERKRFGNMLNLRCW